MKNSLWLKHFAFTTANPRNCASGICQRHDGEGNEFIDFTAFDIECEDSLTTYEQKLNKLRAIGIDTVDYHYVGNKDMALKIICELDEGRAYLDYNIDGLVICINDLKLQSELGYSDAGTRPKFSIAYKLFKYV